MFDRRDPAFNIGDCVEFTGDLDAACFEQALRKAVADTDAFHIRIEETDAGPRQHFDPSPTWSLKHLDFSGAPRPRDAADAWIRGDMGQAFVLDDGPLFRFALLKVAAGRFWWYTVCHHIIIDATGWRLFIAKVAEIYNALMTGSPIERKEVGSWSDMLAEEEAYRHSESCLRDRDFWRQHLSGMPRRLSLSGKPHVRPSGLLRSTARLTDEVDLDEAARRFGVSAATLLTTATAIYLHRCTGAPDVVVGLPINTRVGARMRSSIGLAMNPLPLRLPVSSTDKVSDIFQRVTGGMRSVLRHRRYRNEDIKRDLGFGSRDGELASIYVNYTPDDDVRFGGAAILCNPVANWWVDDLQIVFFGGNGSDGRRLDLLGNPKLYSQQEVDEHCASFVRLLKSLATCRPDATVGDVPLPSAGSAAKGMEPLACGDARSGDVGFSLQNGGLQTVREEPSASPPDTPTEVLIADIWRDILRIPKVYREDDFFLVGGDSLLANILVTRLRKRFRLDVPLSMVFDYPTLQALARAIDQAIEDTRENISIAVIDRVSDSTPAPLSFSQHRMWLIQSLYPQTSAYNISFALRLTGSLDIVAMTAAHDVLRERHEILRTTYAMQDGEIIQHVHAWGSETLELVDLTDNGSEARAEGLARLEECGRIPFDLASGPVFMPILFKIGPDEHWLQWTVHHIAADQWSLGVLARELASIYNACRSGRTPRLTPAPIRYRDFAAWQRRQHNSPGIEAQLGFWRKTLNGAPALSLPTDRPRPRLQSLKGALFNVPMSEVLLDKIEQLGRRQSATLFMTMLAGFAAVLHRLSAQADIPIGVPVANRTDSAVESVVGTFVNTLVLRTDLSGDPTFAELLDRIRKTSLDALANQDVPFDRLVQEIVQTRDTSRSPLTQVLFNMLNAPMHGIELEGVDWELMQIDRGGAQFEISLTVDNQITRSIIVEYNTDLFERGTIERLIERYFTLLEHAAEMPETRLSALDLLPRSERQLVLHTWNETTAPYSDRPFISTFADSAVQFRDKVAVTFGEERATYAQLDARADALARRLAEQGAKTGTAVGVCLDRSLDMLVALLAVQKSGAAYVPLDPKLPKKRLGYMIGDSGLRLIAGSAAALDGVSLPQGVAIVDVVDGQQHVSPAGAAALTPPSPSDPAYVIYTSGSTGRPKGVVVSHGALSNFLNSMRKEPGLTGDDVLAAVTTISFDIAGLELYLPLMVGARIELVPTTTAADGDALSKLLSTSGATLMQATPATWRMLLDAGWQGIPGFRALCGGEAITRELAIPLVERCREVWNLYGPTETTIWSTACLVDAGNDQISVGKPIDNTRIYVLNGTDPAPIGVAGEICIGGDGVAIGYHERPELTAERFQADPFVPGARIYRTGDLGRWGGDGRLYHLGRMDFQVKVRGFRIELGEIEAALDAHPAVRKSVVVAREISAADTRLVAYVEYEKAAPPTVSELRRYLREQLPDYMVPSMIVAVDKHPLTPNGKIDRNALPDPFSSLDEMVTAEPVYHPANRFEAVLLTHWRKALKTDRVGVDDNFFDRGGHSLLALRVVAAIEKELGVKLDPRVLFLQSLRQIAGGLAGKADRGP